MTRLTARSSTIFIATDDKTRVFRSIAEIPPHLRRRLQDSTQGLNSATILIADKRGREELVRAIQGRPTDVQCRLADAIRAQEREDPSRTPAKFPFSLRRWLEVLVPVAVGGALWLFFESRL